LEVNLNIIVDGSSFNIVELWQSLNLEGFKITYSGENRIFSKIIKPEVDEKTNEKRSLMGGNH
jgi:hypothetical protein